MAYDLNLIKARGPLVGIVVLGLIAVATTILRLKARRMMKTKLGIDDYLICIALFCMIISIALQYACVLAGGVGRHVTDVEPSAVVLTLKIILASEVLYGVTICLVKSSVLCLYLRIFGSNRLFRMAAIFLIVFLLLWMISVVFETLLACRPLAKSWDPYLKGVCADRERLLVSGGALNIFTSFMVVLLPIPCLLSLNIAKKRKYGVVLMFTIGTIVIVISIVRILSLEAISFTDPTYTLPMALLWTTLEPCLGIIDANLPMVRSILVIYWPNIFGNSSDDTHEVSGSRPLANGHMRKVNGSGSAEEESEERGDEVFEMMDGDEERGLGLGLMGRARTLESVVGVGAGVVKSRVSVGDEWGRKRASTYGSGMSVMIHVSAVTSTSRRGSRKGRVGVETNNETGGEIVVGLKTDIKDLDAVL